MEKERDVRLVRFDLRLRVGADGDPFDNELHNAWASLPENTVIRNDWLRRRVLLGHILERDGLTELLSAISRIAPAAGTQTADPLPPSRPAPSPAAGARPAHGLQPAAADFLPPEPEAPPAPAAPPRASARQQLGGLLPTIAPSERKEEKPGDASATPSADKPAPKNEPSTATQNRAAATPETPDATQNREQHAGTAPDQSVARPRPRPTLAGDQG